MLRTLMVEAASHESAVHLRDVLSPFGAKIVDGEEGGYGVQMLLDGPEQTSGALSTIQQHVMGRAWGSSARIRLDGCCYVLRTG